MTPADWRADTLAALPDEKNSFRIVTFASALDLIDTAAHNRRMYTEDFIGRAALAVAAYDAGLPWAQVTMKEPPIRNRAAHGLPPKRRYGRNFGPWTITEMT